MTYFENNPNIGLYGIATDEYCLLGRGILGDAAKDISKALGVPVHQITLMGTSLIGVFAAANSNNLLVPEHIFETEKKALDKLKIKYKIINTKLTALGNNILVNDNGAVICPDYTDAELKQIESAFGVKAEKMKIANTEVPGSCAALNKNGCVIHRDISDQQLEKVEKLLKLKCFASTISMGSPYIRSGVLCNSKGMVVSSSSGGPELMYLEQNLGFTRTI